MKRTFATLGALGLASLTLAAPASAAEKTDICHDGKIISIDLSGVGGPHGHSRHPDDIIPPNELLPFGLNWTSDGLANCLAPVPPVVPLTPPDGTDLPAEEDPLPAEEDPLPGGDPLIVDQPADVIQPASPAETLPVQAPAPQAPAAQVPAPQAPAAQAPASRPQAPLAQAAAPKTVKVPAAAATVSRGTNQGFNAQTAVGGTGGTSFWLAGLGALLAAGAAVAVRRKFRTEKPTAV